MFCGAERNSIHFQAASWFCACAGMIEGVAGDGGGAALLLRQRRGVPEVVDVGVLVLHHRGEPGAGHVHADLPGGEGDAPIVRVRVEVIGRRVLGQPDVELGRLLARVAVEEDRRAVRREELAAVLPQVGIPVVGRLRREHDVAVLAVAGQRLGGGFQLLPGRRRGRDAGRLEEVRAVEEPGRLPVVSADRTSCLPRAPSRGRRRRSRRARPPCFPRRTARDRGGRCGRRSRRPSSCRRRRCRAGCRRRSGW